MARVPVQIGRKSDQAQAPSDGVERLVNGYLESVPQGKETAPVYGTPGLNLFTSTNTGPIRGLHVMADKLYMVAGLALSRVSNVGGRTFLGNIDAGDLVDMADDGDHLVIVNRETGKIWVYTGSSGTFVGVTDPDAGPAASVCWLDGYFTFSNSGMSDPLAADQFFISDLGNPLSYNALNYASAEWRPGKLLKVIVLERNVYMLKQHSIEAWYDTGDTASFVYSPRPDVHIPVGLAGSFAVAASNQALYFLADDLTVRRLDGLTPTRISTFAIERLIRGAPELNIPGWTDPSLTRVTEHVWRGHLFLAFNNPDGCVVFDQSTQLWHERETYGRPTWAADSYAYCYGQHCFGDRTAGTVYMAASDSYAEPDLPLSFEVTFPPVYQGNAPFILNSFSLVMDTGRAAVGTNPKVQISYSKDGYTFSPWKTRDLGRMGDYTRQIRLPGFGRARMVVARVRVTDAAPRALLGAYADLEPLSP